MQDQIESAMREYEEERCPKNGILLTSRGGYYLYDNQFCSINDFELFLTGDQICMQGESVNCDLFFGLTEGTLRWSAVENADFAPDRLSLIFHIKCGNGDEVLRGILFARNWTAYLSIFTDYGIEQLYRVASVQEKGRLPYIYPSDELIDIAESCGRNDLSVLGTLYRQSKKAEFCAQRLRKENI